MDDESGACEDLQDRRDSRAAASRQGNYAPSCTVCTELTLFPICGAVYGRFADAVGPFATVPIVKACSLLRKMEGGMQALAAGTRLHVEWHLP